MIQCINFKPLERGMLIGFGDFIVPKWGVELHGCGVFRKGPTYWVMLPSREWKNDVGETQYSPIMKFPVEEHQKAFRNLLKDAFLKYQAENR